MIFQTVISSAVLYLRSVKAIIYLRSSLGLLSVKLNSGKYRQLCEKDILKMLVVVLATLQLNFLDNLSSLFSNSSIYYISSRLL